MTRTVPLLLLLGSASASAAEYASTQQQIRFEGAENVIDMVYELPFGSEIDLGFVGDFWIGVTITLRGTSLFGLQVDGTSDLWWDSDDGQDGLLYHQLAPLPGSGIARMASDVGFSVTFDVRENGANGPFLIQIPLIAQGIKFDLAGADIDPFMLPGQSPDSARLQSSSEQGSFSRPFQLAIPIAEVISFRPGVELRGRPDSVVIFSGNELETIYAEAGTAISAGVDPGELMLYQATPEIELESAYEADVEAVIGYIFNVDLLLGIGLQLGGFPIVDFDFSWPLYEYYAQLFHATRDVDFPSEAYTHPLPVLTRGPAKIDFGTVDVGSTQTYVYGLGNAGLLDVEGLVGVDSLDGTAFSVSPNEIFVGPGGQTGVIITFEPLQEGNHEATLVVRSNDPYRAELRIPIVGKAKVGGFGGGFDTGDTGAWGIGGGGAVVGCQCSTGSSAPVGAWVLLGVVPLLALRRRQG